VGQCSPPKRENIFPHFYFFLIKIFFLFFSAASPLYFSFFLEKFSFFIFFWVAGASGSAHAEASKQHAAKHLRRSRSASESNTPPDNLGVTQA